LGGPASINDHHLYHHLFLPSAAQRILDRLSCYALYQEKKDKKNKRMVKERKKKYNRKEKKKE
jgi:hypothetical protein